MIHIMLDSSPLGVLLQKPGYPQRDRCRDWVVRHLGAGNRLYVPEIIEYELRRELLRMNKTNSVKALEVFADAVPNRKLLLNTADLRLAAELWAKARQQGRPTADVHALDVDVILCAQVLNSSLPQPDVVVATSNTRHLSQFVDARDWATI
jgi:predicted nucleic acid-binding protein